jgi:glycosyltransferase involved in cell wall biosynthesis
MSFKKDNHGVIPVISVILPVYNGEKYVAESIDSILNQTFTDFELIIINDGSTDNSLQVLQAYQKFDTRIRLITRENKGLVATLNEGIDLARGAWIARMDADDISMPQRFEKQLQWLTKTKADICGSWIRFFGAENRPVRQHPHTDAGIKAEMLFSPGFAHPTVMMKAALVKLERYDSAWENAEDYDLWERAVRAGWKMTNVPEVLLCYRLHEQQVSKATIVEQQQKSQKIRRRYWEFAGNSLGIKSEWRDEVMKIREPSASISNMDYVDLAFTRLLQHHHGEEQKLLFEHVTYWYFLVGSQCPNIVSRWSQLNKQFGNGFALAIKLRLWLLCILHIDSNSRCFNYLKKLYLYYTALHEKF